MKVGLVACCASKRRERSQARFLYVSPLFVLSAAAASSLGDWAILSAKHGLLRPTDQVDPYDETLDGMSRRVREKWAEDTGAKLRETFPGATFVVFAGKLYCAALGGLDWVDALRGLPIGKRLKALKDGTWTR